MISRRKLLKGGAAAVVVASVPFINARRTFAQSAAAFDYYISATGDDNNAGTLSSPWSITALNSKMSQYAGKRIGVIGDQGVIQHGTVGGVQSTLYSIHQSQNGNNGGTLLNINGGNSGASTYIASCNSSGVYTPRLAIIDCANPSGGAVPTVSALVMGQNFYQGSVPNPGYTTVDGLTIRNFTYGALAFSNLGGTLNGILIQNCEIYNGGNVPSTNNPGAIKLGGAVNPVITNNRIHDLRTISGGATAPWGHSALMTYTSVGITFTHNTCYNCSSVLTKDTHQWFANCSYNYLDHGVFGSASTGGDLDAGSIVGHSPGSGQTSVIHHNIFLGQLDMHAQDGQNIAGTVRCYNNTFYGTPSYATPFSAVRGDAAVGGAGFQFLHNIVYASANGYDHGTQSGDCMWLTGTVAIALATFNNNVYGSNSNAVAFGRAYAQNQSLANWTASTGCDANSVLVSSSPFSGSPTAQIPLSFAVTGSAVIGGVTCGAIDGSGTVGCNFGVGPVPAAPALAVS